MTAELAAFDADLLHAHRTALRALCEIIDHPALTGAGPAPKPILHQLALRLRGAVALLRTRPLGKAPQAPTPGRDRSTVQPESTSTAAAPAGPALRSLVTTASAAARALSAAAGSPTARPPAPSTRRPAA